MQSTQNKDWTRKSSGNQAFLLAKFSFVNAKILLGTEVTNLSSPFAI